MTLAEKLFGQECYGYAGIGSLIHKIGERHDVWIDRYNIKRFRDEIISEIVVDVEHRGHSITHDQAEEIYKEIFG